jgi:hypothetical protein
MDDNHLTPFGKFISHAGFIMFISGLIGGFLGYEDFAWVFGSIGFILILFISLFR